MFSFLGTELRMNCNCNGSGGIVGDFRRLYDCIGYQRLFWLNPCIGKLCIIQDLLLS